MRTRRYEDDAAPGRYLVARLHKMELEATHAIRCSRCRYHKGENTTWLTRHTDLRKRHVPWKKHRVSTKDWR